MDCLFCKIVNGEIPSDKVYEDDEILAFRDKFPVAPTHILIIPKKHIESLREIAGHEELIGKIMKKAADIAKEEKIDEEGYRIVNNIGKNGGQTVFHLHVHLLGGRAFAWPPG
ncbi:MAG: histidine triad nucleotide-binding protein [Candidatus Hydrogenedentota bacterium]|nr:MAG: histidine triad nucleotide-binding protein [Candidatus Hydrogenedentota bacterium]